MYIILALIITLLFFIKFFKGLKLKKCPNCNRILKFKYFIFSKICVKSCVSCDKIFIRKTRRSKNIF